MFNLSVVHFKAIDNLKDYPMKSMNILSGTNSGGKTSLIQLLLLLKQSLERNIEKNTLILNGPYVSLGKYKDISFNNVLGNKLKISFKMDKKELRRLSPRLLRGSKSLKDITNKITDITMDVEFRYVSNRLYIEKVLLIYHILDEHDVWLECKRIRAYKYSVSSNTNIFFGDPQSSQKFHDSDNIFEGEIYFDGFFPESFYSPKLIISFSPLLQLVKGPLKRYFNSMTYIGPLRDEPHAYYLNSHDYIPGIGNKGEFAAQILAKHATEVVRNYHIEDSENGSIVFIKKEETLEEAVKYWICKVFGMAKDIKVKKFHEGVLYVIEVTNHFGLKTPITHVGFGISQVLPIVVEGLRTVGGTLILEQPEIHLHPKVQSLLFDFLYSLTISGKKLIIETHSDHFITRLRRRIAEDLDNTLAKNINLTFIEKADGVNKYNRLDLTDFGGLTYWPKDFFDQLDKDVRAIVKAQSRKRKLNSPEGVELR